ncbi:MAG: SAM-dependent MidA family methyltransferase [Acidimicrobiales bacterium]
MKQNGYVLERFEHRVMAEIGERGPIRFSQFVEAALYDADFGFYTTSGRAGGRRGDFVTSVEVGPLFAAVLADWLDGVWRALGEPAVFRVCEAGAGVGTLFRGINRAAPACFAALTYTLVERSAVLRVAHQSLPGEAWRSAAVLPKEHQHVVMANELLDNLSFDIAERVTNGWAFVDVGADSGRLGLQAGPADRELDHLSDLAPDANSGTRVPVALQAREWVKHAVANADRVLVFDYAASTPELARRDQAGWLRTYAGHRRGSDPLVDPGQSDITHDVPIDQLPLSDQQHLQADWLNLHGLPERVKAARQTWTERAHIGDLQAMAARSAIGEAEALTDPAGLGSFVVLEWR